MIHSLRLRLLLMLIIAVMVPVGTVALVASQALRTEFDRFVKRDTMRFESLASFAASYQPDHSQERVHALLGPVQQAFGERILLIDAKGRIIADSDQKLVGKMSSSVGSAAAVVLVMKPALGQVGVSGQSLPYDPGASRPAVPVPAPGPTAPHSGTGGTVLAAAARPDFVFSVKRADGGGLGPLEAIFINSVTRSLWMAAGAAGFVALFLTFLFSRGILGPVEALTAAARQMGKGDLSHRVQVTTRDEIGELARAFNAMADGLTRLEQLRRTMVSDVAHELRTPLSNIRGYLEALRDEVLRPTAGVIDSLHEEALLLSRLVDDLQELALAEAGQLRLVRQPVELGEIVEKAVNSVRPLAADKGLAVRVDLPSDLPLVDADPERIGQVLRNLLSNAVSYTPAGGEISVAATALGEHVETRVRDTGVGIAPEHLPLIFGRFYRVDPSRTRATGGAGLGLAIVKRLVELHGGRVEAESTPGAGSTFRFTLPVAESAPASS